MLRGLLVLCCLLAPGYSDDEEESESHVLDLTADTFEDAIASSPVILVKFFAPWCGHCKRLAPEYESIATELSLDDPTVPLAKVNATVATSLSNRFAIDGYPTLMVFHQGTPYDYKALTNSTSWRTIVDEMKGLWCSSTVRLLSTQT